MEIARIGDITALLAQAAPKAAPTSLFVVIGALIAAVVVLGSVILIVRRKTFENSRDNASSAGLMEQLRTLHREGKLSDEEFSAVIAKMKQRVRAEAGLSVDRQGAAKRPDESTTLQRDRGPDNDVE